MKRAFQHVAAPQDANSLRLELEELVMQGSSLEKKQRRPQSAHHQVMRKSGFCAHVRQMSQDATVHIQLKKIQSGVVVKK